MMLCGITDAILLVAMGVGYIVCYLANREGKTLRTAGYFIGVFIIALSAILIVSNLFLGTRCCRKMGGMMMKGYQGTMPPPMMPSQPQR